MGSDLLDLQPRHEGPALFRSGPGSRGGLAVVNSGHRRERSAFRVDVLDWADTDLRFREIIKINRVPLQQTDHIEAGFSNTL